MRTIMSDVEACVARVKQQEQEQERRTRKAQRIGPCKYACLVSLLATEEEAELRAEYSGRLATLLDQLMFYFEEEAPEREELYARAVRAGAILGLQSSWDWVLGLLYYARGYNPLEEKTEDYAAACDKLTDDLLAAAVKRWAVDPRLAKARAEEVACCELRRVYAVKLDIQLKKEAAAAETAAAETEEAEKEEETT